jgi:uncharacterized protein (TIGR02246 family)
MFCKTEGEMVRTRFNLTRVTVGAAVAPAAALLLLSSPLLSRAAERAAAQAPSKTPSRTEDQAQGTEADSAAIKQVFAEWYEAFSRHDAHAAAMTFAEDGDFTNMGGVHNHGRKEIEAHLAMLFAGNLKAARRTDIVKSIRFVTPRIAEVNADTLLTGTLRADGSEVPPRKGLMVTTMTKQDGRWLISVFHEVEFPPAPPAR